MVRCRRSTRLQRRETGRRSCWEVAVGIPELGSWASGRWELTSVGSWWVLRLARLTGRTKSYYVNQALEDQIQVLETRSFADRAARHASECRERIVPLYELECALGLDD